MTPHLLEENEARSLPERPDAAPSQSDSAPRRPSLMFRVRGTGWSKRKRLSIWTICLGAAVVSGIAGLLLWHADASKGSGNDSGQSAPRSETPTPSAASAAAVPQQAVVTGDPIVHKARAFYMLGDYVGAIPLFARACHAGNTESCVSLGEIYEKGRVVPANPARAQSYYKQACDAGDQAGCLALAQVHLPSPQ